MSLFKHRFSHTDCNGGKHYQIADAESGYWIRTVVYRGKAYRPYYIESTGETVAGYPDTQDMQDYVTEWGL